MPDNAHSVAQEPAIWCSNMCPGVEAHEILNFISTRFKENKDNGRLDSKGWQELHEKLSDLSRIIYKVKCYKLNAYAIHVCKGSAFLNIENGSTFVTQLYEVICDVWNTGYAHNGNLGSIDDLLDGWIHDLPIVKNDWLPIYLQILPCDGLITNPKFNRALEALETHLLSNLSDDPALIDECGDRLIAFVLEPLLNTNPQSVIDCLPFAVNIAVSQASDSNFKSVRALRQLIEHLFTIQRYRQKTKSKKDGQLDFQSLTNQQDKLSSAFRQARNNKHINLCRELEQLLPLSGNWKRERHLKAPEQLHVDATLPIGIQFNAAIKEIDQHGHYYLMCSDDITEAACVKGTNREVYLKQKCPIKIVDLFIKHKNGQKYRFNEANAVFRMTGSSNVISKIYATRGWQYKHSNFGKAGFVFYVADPPVKKKDISKLESFAIGEGEAEANDETDAPICELKGGQKQELPPLFIPSPEGIVEGIVEFFKNMSDDILLRKLWKSLRTGHPKKPIDELEIDALIRQSFPQYIESRGGNLSCQGDAGLGSCDYVVSRAEDKVVIELKRSSHQQLRQGLETELPTHMMTNETKHGIFLVFAFNAAFKKGSAECKNLIQLRDTVSKEMNLNIRIVIINCDKPESASKRKTTPVSGDRLQQY